MYLIFYVLLLITSILLFIKINVFKNILNLLKFNKSSNYSIVTLNSYILISTLSDMNSKPPFYKILKHINKTIEKNNNVQYLRHTVKMFDNKEITYVTNSNHKNAFINDKVTFSTFHKAYVYNSEGICTKAIHIMINLYALRGNEKHIFDYITKTTFYIKKNQINNSKIRTTLLNELGWKMKTFSNISYKTFDNMFFTDKHKLLNCINEFQNNVEIHNKLGINHTLGILFYGEPHCGKSSAISCVANYLKRQINIININQLHNIELLSAALHHKCSEKIYVFENIDENDLSEVFMCRNIKAQQENNKEDKKIITVVNQDGFVKQVEEVVKKNITVTLADILELLDGLIEMPGRIIIFNTTKCDQFDKAFMRPGRIDLKINFEKMTIKDICDMYNLWFKQVVPQVVVEQMKEKVFSVAEIKAIFEYDDETKIFEALIKCKNV